jgi:hypothetical protein
MATIPTHQPRPVPAFRRQRSACIVYPSPPLNSNQSQSSVSFPSTMDLHHRSYRPNRPIQFPSLNHHLPHTPPSHHRRSATTSATANASFGHRSSPSLSSTYPLVYSPSENSYQNTPSMSADIQHEYPFDISFTTSSMSFADVDLSQSAFLNPGQLPWSDSKSDFKVESSPVPQPVFFADDGSYAFYNDSNTNPAVDAHVQPSKMLSSAPQQVVYFNPSAENDMDMEGDLELHYPPSSPSPHALSQSAGPAFVQPSENMSPSPPAFLPFPRVPGSSSPPGLTSELDEDLGSESSESEAGEPLDGPDGDDDTDIMPSRTMSRSWTRTRRTSSVSVSSGNDSVRDPRPCRLTAPVPVPNLAKKSRGRRVPTAPVFIVQGGVQKNMRMYRCTVEGCYKCFARGEHLKRHVRSIHTNEKREYLISFRFVVAILTLLQRTSVLSRDAGRISVGTICSGSTCAYTRVKVYPTCSTREPIVLSTKTRPPFFSWAQVSLGHCNLIMEHGQFLLL